MDEIYELSIPASFDSSVTSVTAGGTEKGRRELVDTALVDVVTVWWTQDRCTSGMDLGDFAIGLC